VARERRSISLYQQGRQQVAGVRARLKDGESADAPSAVWLVSASSLGGLVPKAGDRCRGTDGVWRAVREVGALAGDDWPCTCEREGGAE
jgi:hypothetical protein